MRINRGLLGWGVFLLLVGAIPLAVRAGVLTEDQVRDVGRLWPLIIVGVGVGLVLARTRFAFVGGFVIAATFGVMVGGWLTVGGIGFAGGCGSTAGTTPFPETSGTFNTAEAVVDIELNCGELSLAATPGTAWRVDGADENGAGPFVEHDVGTLILRPRRGDSAPFDLLGARQSWNVALPDAQRTVLALKVNAGSGKADLSGLDLREVDVLLNAGSIVMDLGQAEGPADLKVQVNAGSFKVTFPRASVEGSIEVNAGSIDLCIPPGTAIRIDTTGSVVSGFDFGKQGLIEQDGVWTTPDYGVDATAIDLKAHANAGSISLNPEDGCDE